MRPARVLAGVVLLLLSPAAAQAGRPLPRTFPSGPAYPLVFDDFDYRAAPAYSPTGDAGRPGGPPGSVFGVTDWWVGDYGAVPYRSYSRAWYASLVLEPENQYGSWFRNDDDYYVRATPPDAQAHVPSTLDLGTEGWMHVRPGQDLGWGPQIVSGFMARTGTWLARVRIPSFAGLHSYAGAARPAADGAADAIMVPAFWAQSYWASETRTALTLSGGDRVWSEWNFEFGNHHDAATYRFGDQPPNPPLSIGVMWALGQYHGQGSRWTTLASGSPVLGEREPGECVVRDEAGRERYAGLGTCFRMLTNQPDSAGRRPFRTRRGAPWHPYLYLSAEVTAETSRFGITIRDEHADGTPADLVDGFETMRMTTPVFYNFVAPQPMATFFSLQFFCPNAETGCRTDARREMNVDWFLFTPAASRGVDAMVADVAMWKAYFAAAGTDARASRLHTLRYTDLGERSADRVVLASRHVYRAPHDPACYSPIRPALPFDVSVELRRGPARQGRGGHDLLLAVFRQGPDVVPWRNPVRVQWDVSAGRGRRPRTVTDEGFSLELDAALRRQGPLDVRVTVTQLSDVNIFPQPQWVPSRTWPRLPAVCGTGRERDLTVVHTYRYDPTRRTLTPTG